MQNGADAIYMGMGNFNARRGAKNFTDEEFEKAVRYCRIRGCKVYVTLNTLVGDREMEAAVAAARLASQKGADAILVQDLGLARAIRQALPDIPIHASTQMSIHNLAGVEAAAEMGLTRAVLARELSLEQIKFISKHASIETEIFVHGALCFCHSGQCYMSSLIGRRSGNRGMCAQPCRMQYSLGGRMDDYPLSLKDNCLVDRLQEIEDAGVKCVKIEGRMKPAGVHRHRHQDIFQGHKGTAPAHSRGDELPGAGLLPSGLYPGLFLRGQAGHVRHPSGYGPGFGEDVHSGPPGLCRG
ncbi:MAG: peptidase U32 family protein [Oscillospiraceae bacterium]